MKREIIITSDGSSSIYLPEWDEPYHSKHGAIQEAYHVFIKSGLEYFKEKEKLSILEIGFGTGLNALITFIESQKRKDKIEYTGVEAYPVLPEEVKQLNYVEQLHINEKEDIFKKMHTVQWERPCDISKDFKLIKQKKSFTQINDKDLYNLIYFDAFSPDRQPELWSPEIFEKMYLSLKDHGILVTYSAKGSVRRALQSAGFVVERLPGPPGKREMMRAIKKENN
ncbi:MAG: SAM-dependent methyltransferase [Flavobacteriia bacterium]|nr:MAG: SAM-dependent methyltransferase [Flavobacteriia bacterium]